MGFYQFCTILIYYIYLISLNAFTAEAADLTYTLTLNATGKACPASDTSSTITAPQSDLLAGTSPSYQCIVGTPFEKFEMTCIPSANSPSELVITWYNKDKQLQENEKIYFSDKGNKLTFKSLNVTDIGKYECRLAGKDNNGGQPVATGVIEVQVLPYVSGIRKEVTAIEENQINLVCSVITNVDTKVVWSIGTPGWLQDQNEGRMKFENTNNSSLTNNILTIGSANMTLDRGYYNCSAESKFGYSAKNMTFYVRVKSKYAALWPFIGICAEVIVLCVVILIYEKKRDKTELEESDTDQGPETKSSPDHGQDNVRYRK